MSKVVVIGAGVIGLSCAYELVRLGADVTVLDKGQPGKGAAWGSAGWVTQMLSAPLPAPGLVGTSLKWMLRGDSPLYMGLRGFVWVSPDGKQCNSLCGKGIQTSSGAEKWSIFRIG